MMKVSKVERISDGVRELFNQNGMLEHLWMLVISFVAGLLSHFERMQDKEKYKFHLYVFIYDITASSFMGLMAFYACLSAELDVYMIGVIVGVFAHGGTKGLSLIMKLVAGKYKVSVKIDADEDKK